MPANAADLEPHPSPFGGGGWVPSSAVLVVLSVTTRITTKVPAVANRRIGVAVTQGTTKTKTAVKTSAASRPAPSALIRSRGESGLTESGGATVIMTPRCHLPR